MTRASAAPSATRLYHQLRERRLIDLLGGWVSELEPIIVERIDVSPEILAEVGIAAPGGTVPMMIARVTVDDMIAAGVLR